MAKGDAIGYLQATFLGIPLVPLSNMIGDYFYTLKSREDYDNLSAYTNGSKLLLPRGGKMFGRALAVEGVSTEYCQFP